MKGSDRSKHRIWDTILPLLLCACFIASSLLFLVQMKGVSVFRPHEARDPKFAEALRKAAQAGVKVLAYDCKVWETGFCLDAPVPVEL